MNGFFIGRQVAFLNIFKVFFDYRLDWHGGNVTGTAYRYRNTTDSSTILKESFIDQLRNMAQNRIVAGVCDHIPVKNKFPCVFQIQYLLHVRCCHAVDDAVIDDVFRLGKAGGDTLLNCLIVDVGLHVGTGEIKVQLYTRGNPLICVAELCQFLV